MFFVIFPTPIWVNQRCHEYLFFFYSKSTWLKNIRKCAFSVSMGMTFYVTGTHEIQ